MLDADAECLVEVANFTACRVSLPMQVRRKKEREKRKRKKELYW